jgi:TolB-like protein
MTLTSGMLLGPYEVRAPVGAGGMGEVYRATDTRLGRSVAIKILPKEVSLDPARRQRFEREAKAISGLNHPNICVLHDVGSQDEVDFLVLELLEGETLRERLKRGPIELPTVLDWGAQIADGLAALHGKGIVHRDLKPENLFVTKDDRVKILDFGLAKITQLEALPTVTTVTFTQESEPGLLLGTLGYMSPEQARGESIDARTDLFSLGVVLYEMITSKSPFAGPTPAVIFNLLLTAPPPAASRLRDNLPPALERIVDKALEKDRALRFQAAGEIKSQLVLLKRELDMGVAPAAMEASGQRKLGAKLLGAVLLVAVIAAAALRMRTKLPTVHTPAFGQATTVAVLPFQNTANDSTLDYLSTALPDEIVTALSYAPTVSVRPLSMSGRFVGPDADPQQAGKELRVQRVLTGHYRRQGELLHVILEAMDTARAEIVWRGTVAVPTNDVLKLRDEITNSMQRGLLPAIGISGAELSITKPKSEEAYKLYLESQDSRYSSLARNKEGIALLEKSLSLDAGYAPAWIALGSRYYSESDLVTADGEMFKKCIAAFEKAHQLDPNLLAASTWLIGTHGIYGDPGVAFSEIRELAERRPHQAEVHHLLAQALRWAGALESAAKECEMTHQLDPELDTDCFVLHIYRGDLTKARLEINRVSGEFSTFMLGQVFLREGKIAEALPRLKAVPVPDNYGLIHVCVEDPSSAGCSSTAKQAEEMFLSLPDKDAWYFGAAMLAFVGKKDAAIRLLNADTNHGFCIYPAVDNDPLFDRIRQTPEFKTARQEGIECQKKFASHARIQIQ